jgi:hypothetical protein
MPDTPEGFTDAQWHITASNDAGVDHSLHPRQYVITCEWCDAVFWGPRKADAMRDLDRHREEVYERYVDEGVAAGDFPRPARRTTASIYDEGEKR